MMNGVMLLASYAYFSGGTLGNLLAQWEAAGIFAYALPFLLIFALVLGLLNKMNIFGSRDNPNRGVNVMIALAVSFMALQFNVVPMFFSELFPRFGVGLSVILVILIMFGIFIPTNKESNWFMIGLALVVLVIVGIVVWNSISAMGWSLLGSGWLISFWDQYSAIIIFIVIILGVILATTTKKNPNRPKYSSMFSRSLGED